MPSQPKKPSRNTYVQNPQAKQPAQALRPPPRNPFSLGGRRFNGQATRRGTRH
jgi:hypothetical protein